MKTLYQCTFVTIMVALAGCPEIDTQVKSGSIQINLRLLDAKVVGDTKSLSYDEVEALLQKVVYLQINLLQEDVNAYTFVCPVIDDEVNCELKEIEAGYYDIKVVAATAFDQELFYASADVNVIPGETSNPLIILVVNPDIIGVTTGTFEPVFIWDHQWTDLQIVATDPGGTTTVSPEADERGYPYGSEVTVEAIPDPGYEFRYWDWSYADPWMLPADLTTNPLHVVMNGDLIIKPIFVELDGGQPCYEIEAEPTYVDSINSGSVYDINVYGRNLFVDTGWNMDVFSLLDIADSGPVYSHSFSTWDVGIGHWAFGPGVVYGYLNSYLSIVDVGNGEVLSRIYLPSGVTNLMTKDDFLYAEGSSSLSVIDVSDPSAPGDVIEYNISSTYHMVINDGRLFVSNQVENVTDVYMVDGADITYWLTIPEALQSLVANDDILGGIRATDNDSHVIYDLSSVAPVSLGDFQAINTCNLAMDCGYYMVSGSWDEFHEGEWRGVKVFDVTTLEIVSEFEVPSPNKIITYNGHAIVQISGSNVRIYNLTSSE